MSKIAVFIADLGRSELISSLSLHAAFLVQNPPQLRGKRGILSRAKARIRAWAWKTGDTVRYVLKWRVFISYLGLSELISFALFTAA